MGGRYWYKREGDLVVCLFAWEKNDGNLMTFDYSLSVNKGWYYHSNCNNDEGHLCIRAAEK